MKSPTISHRRSSTGALRCAFILLSTRHCRANCTSHRAQCGRVSVTSSTNQPVFFICGPRIGCISSTSSMSSAWSRSSRARPRRETVARIDSYLRSLERFGALGLVLRSGGNVMLRFPAGDRHATQATPHAQLVELVDEIAPPDAQRRIRADEAAEFVYATGGVPYSV